MYLNSLLLIFNLYFVISEDDICYCLFSNATQIHGNEPFGNIASLQCTRTHPDAQMGIPVACHKIDKLIGIGPLNSDLFTNSDKTAQFTKWTIAPWAFSDLFSGTDADSLQLDLSLKDNTMNALTMGGLDTLRVLLARTSIFHWDGCSFADLPRLEQVALNCKAGFDDFLTFGPRISVIHLVDCADVPRQFYCVRCLQNPNVSVIRIRPGPPQRNYLVKFAQLDRPDSIKSGELNHFDNLELQKCVLDFCSDDMLCRSNEAFRLARNRKEELAHHEEIASSGITFQQSISFSSSSLTTASQIGNGTTSSELSTMPILTETKDSNTSTDKLLRVFNTLAVTSPSPILILPTSYKVWIASAVLILIVGSLFTLCLLIVINHQRTRKRRLKLSRKPPPLITSTSETGAITPSTPCLPNGNMNGNSILLDNENKIELPEIV